MNVALRLARCLAGLIAFASTSVASGFDGMEGSHSRPHRDGIEKNHFILCCASTEAWTAVADMNRFRRRAVATLLPDGKVLVAGGGGSIIGVPEVHASAELYDPASDSWTFTGNMRVSRLLASATLLADSRFLVVGGLADPLPESDDFFSYSATAEFYDAVTGRWNLTAPLPAPSAGHSATLLRDGRVLVAGGQTPGVSSVENMDTAELYDPSTETWGPSGRLASGKRQAHTATLLSDGRVLVTGGWLGSFRNSEITSTCEIYDPSTGQWSRVGDMGAPRIGHTATALPSGKVLVAGGANISGDLPSAELFDPATGQWTPTSNLNDPRGDHTATLLPNGNVLVAGGVAEGDDSITRVVTRTEIYDTATGTWRPGAHLIEGRFAHTATLLRDGSVLIAGGMEVVNAWAGGGYQTESISSAERSPGSP